MGRLNLCILILIFNPFVSCCQNLDHLYDLFFDAKGITYAKPLTKLDFDDPKIRSHFTDYIDSVHYHQLIANIKNVDSSLWTDQELKNHIIVCDNEPFLQWETLKSKFINIDKKDEDNYKKDVDYYNRNPLKRLIYRVSKPIFDDKKELAVMEYQYSKTGYGVSIYKLRNGVWEEVVTRATYF